MVEVPYHHTQSDAKRHVRPRNDVHHGLERNVATEERGEGGH